MEVGRRDSGSRRTLAAINVTPMVDIMLVLLIIFMVTAPMMEQGLHVNLPEVQNAPGLNTGNEPLVVTVGADGAISVGRSKVDTPAKLTPVLQQMLASHQDRQVLLEADRSVPYGRVVQVMAAIRGAGVEKLGMVSQPPKD